MSNSIAKVPGHVWPLDIQCDVCGISFKVTQPSDLINNTVYNYREINGERLPYVERRYVTTACPVCKKVHELQDNQVPTIFTTYNAIPAAPGEKPICG